VRSGRYGGYKVIDSDRGEIRGLACESSRCFLVSPSLGRWPAPCAVRLVDLPGSCRWALPKPEFAKPSPSPLRFPRTALPRCCSKRQSCDRECDGAAVLDWACRRSRPSTGRITAPAAGGSTPPHGRCAPGAGRRPAPVDSRSYRLGRRIWIAPFALSGPGRAGSLRRSLP